MEKLNMKKRYKEGEKIVKHEKGRRRKKRRKFLLLLLYLSEIQIRASVIFHIEKYTNTIQTRLQLRFIQFYFGFYSFCSYFTTNRRYVSMDINEKFHLQRSNELK